MRLKKLLSVVTAVAVALSAVVVAPAAKKTVNAATTGTGTIDAEGKGWIAITGYTSVTDTISITVVPDDTATTSSDWNSQFMGWNSGYDGYNGAYFTKAVSGTTTVQEILDANSFTSLDELAGIAFQITGATEGETYTYSYDIIPAASDTPNYSASMEILPNEPNWENGYLRIPTTGLSSISSDITIEATYSGTRPSWGTVIDIETWGAITDTSANPWITEGVIICSLTSDAWEACLTQGEFVLQTDNSVVTEFTSVKLSYKSEGTDTFKQVSAADANNKHRERMVKLVKLSDLENAASVDFTFTAKEKEYTKSAYTYYTSITADGATLTPGTGWVFVTYAITGMPAEASIPLESISAIIVNN